MDSYSPLRCTLMEQFISPIFIFKNSQQRERESRERRERDGKRNTEKKSLISSKTRERGGERERLNFNSHMATCLIIGIIYKSLSNSI